MVTAVVLCPLLPVVSSAQGALGQATTLSGRPCAALAVGKWPRGSKEKVWLHQEHSAPASTQWVRQVL